MGYLGKNRKAWLPGKFSCLASGVVLCLILEILSIPSIRFTQKSPTQRGEKNGARANGHETLYFGNVARPVFGSNSAPAGSTCIRMSVAPSVDAFAGVIVACVAS
jgi:hypothetical protein